MGVKVHDRDKGYKKRVAHIRRSASGPPVSVGILAEDASDSDSNGTTVLDKAIWNEFGTVGPDGRVRVPERSFLRVWFDLNHEKAKMRWRKLYDLVARGTLTRDQAAERFGMWAVGGIQQRMADGVPPPNAEVTVERKGSSTPLIDTGQLRSAISFRVH